MKQGGPAAKMRRRLSACCCRESYGKYALRCSYSDFCSHGLHGDGGKERDVEWFIYLHALRYGMDA